MRPPVRVNLTLVAAGVVVLASSPRAYVGDDRFEKYWAPGLRLLRELSMWDPARGLGRVREDFWPGVTLPVAALRALGASPALGEHLWHASLVVIGGLGMVAVVRLFRPVVGIEHAVAGLVYMFNPYSATFLIPSALFFSYAMAPWLLSCFVTGVRSREPWRWAAGFALLIFLFGDTDIPGLIYALVPILGMAVYLVHIERTARWRDVLAWLGRAAMLAVVVCAAALVKLRFGAGAFADRLATTESPKLVNLTSSWSESWRGLGFWLMYYRDQFGLARPQGRVLLASWPVVAATFVVPCAALAAVWRSRWRPRLAFLIIALTALALMVGSYPIGNPTPYGRLLQAGYQHVPGLAGLRNSYKAGAGLMIGLAALFSLGAVAAARSVARRNRWLRDALVTSMVAVVMLAALPFFTGRLYASNTELTAIPAYWRRAPSWIDRQPGTTRVLILPGSTRTAYRWGWTGDDIFDALLRRPHIIDTAVPLSNPSAANLISSLSQAIAAGTYRPGDLAPLARRLGVEFVLIRNDLDWSKSGSPRPFQLDAVRRDPDLRRAATFGLPGQNILKIGDRSLDSSFERSLPPVEVYAVGQPSPVVQARPDVPPVLVSGDGAAWPSLAQQGLLSDGRSVVYTGDLDAAQLAGYLASGSPFVETDTDRRRLVEAAGSRTRASYTLAAGENLDRPTAQLFTAPETQSVSVFGQAKAITASSTGSSGAGFDRWLRPANAFDGDEATAWEGAGLQKAVGAWIRVELRQPITVSHVSLVAAGTNGRRPSRASLHFSDGSTVKVDLRSGRATAEFRARSTTSIEVRVDAVVGAGLGPVGFAEIAVPGLDLSESIQTPIDVFDAAHHSQTIRSMLATAPIAFNFSRLRGDGPQDEELVMHRRFDVVSPREMQVDATVSVGQATPDQLIDQLVGGASGAWGSSRFLGAVDGAGEQAIDGREDTGWLADPRPGEVLAVRYPARPVHRVEVDVAANHGFSTPADLIITVGTSAVDVPVPRVTCPAQAAVGAPECVAKVAADFPAVKADGLTVRLGSVAPQGAGRFEDLPVGVLEVRADGPLPALPASLSPAACVPGVLSVDNATVNVGVGGSVGALLSGQPVNLHSCGTTRLDSGAHRLDTSDVLSVDQLHLTSRWPPPPPTSEASPRVTVLERSPTHFRVQVEATGSSVVTIGQSHDRGWQARLDGRPLRLLPAADTLAAWRVPHAGILDVRYTPQQPFTRAIAISVLGLVLCGWVLVRRTPRR